MYTSVQFRDCEASIVSFTTWATVNLTDFRNGEPVPKGQVDEGKCCRKITAELGYVVLLLVSVIEFVVRAILSLIAAPLLFIMGCLDCSGMGLVASVSLWGTIVTGENVVKLAALLFKNLSEDYINYDRTAHEFSSFNGELLGSINECYGGKLR